MLEGALVKLKAIAYKLIDYPELVAVKGFGNRSPQHPQISMRVNGLSLGAYEYYRVSTLTKTKG